MALIEARRQDVLRRGEGLWLAANDWGSAIRHNGLGRYEEALALAEQAAETARGLGAVDRFATFHDHRSRGEDRRGSGRRGASRPAAVSVRPA